MRPGNPWFVPIVTIMLAAPIVEGQVVIDMPPPPAKTAPIETSAEAGTTETAEAGARSAEHLVSVGEIALARYRYARMGAANTYISLPSHRRYYGRGFYGPSWCWDACWCRPFGGSPFVWRGFTWSWSGVTVHRRSVSGDG
jgi:hypothetical protein